jgi:hypothetical protein
MDNCYRDYEMDKIVSLKQVIYWPNFETSRRRRRGGEEGGGGEEEQEETLSFISIFQSLIGPCVAFRNTLIISR